MNKWYIPDCYEPGISNGTAYVSHEAVCFLNESDKDAEVKITLYFEDRPKMEGSTGLLSPVSRNISFLSHLKTTPAV